MIYDISYALFKLRPGAKWAHRGEGMDFNGIEWLDEDVTQPTNEEILEIINEADSLEPMRLLRQERDKRLLATDWWAVSDRTITNAQKEYRQLLRDITINATPTILPNNKLNLDSINWPTMP
jgi:hypothetical protein